MQSSPNNGKIPVANDGPMQRDEQDLDSRIERVVAAQKSYLGPAATSLFLYALCFLPGLLFNLVWLREARRAEDIAGRQPAGMGCLYLALMFGTGGWVVILIVALTLGLSRPDLFSNESPSPSAAAAPAHIRQSTPIASLPRSTSFRRPTIEILEPVAPEPQGVAVENGEPETTPPPPTGLAILDDASFEILNHVEEANTPNQYIQVLLHNEDPEEVSRIHRAILSQWGTPDALVRVHYIDTTRVQPWLSLEGYYLDPGKPIQVNGKLLDPLPTEIEDHVLYRGYGISLFFNDWRQRLSLTGNPVVINENGLPEPRNMEMIREYLRQRSVLN
ncbi:hypothetical protein KQI84_01290 [bacterium]|nr:hypothetical protein [bacterium]